MTIDFENDEFEKLLRGVACEAYTRSRKCRGAKSATKFLELSMTCLLAAGGYGDDEQECQETCAVGFQYDGEDED